MRLLRNLECVSVVNAFVVVKLPVSWNHWVGAENMPPRDNVYIENDHNDIRHLMMMFGAVTSCMLKLTRVRL